MPSNMSENHYHIFVYFLTRTSMFTGKENQDTITSFLSGFELGTKREFHITEDLNSFLIDKYNIRSSSTKYIGQIDEFAKANNFDWITAFKRLSFELLFDSGRFNVDPELDEILKSRILSKIKQTDYDWVKPNFLSWANDWFAIVNLEHPEFRNLWTPEQLASLEQYDKELRLSLTSNQQPSEQLISLSEKIGVENENTTQ